MFTSVKLLVYCLLCLNIFLFLDQELQALEHTFVDGIALGQIIQAFAATIDTAAWFILLVLFELETWVLDDRHIRGPLKAALHGLRGLCYVLIVWAFTGYYTELQNVYQVTVSAANQACDLVGQGYSLMLALAEYAQLGPENCVAVGGELVQLDNFNIVADAPTLQRAQQLAWIAVLNSLAWILVCLFLEVEVRLQLRGALKGSIMGIGRVLKFALYGVLFAAAAYWGAIGDFLDFWDAALWLFAFLFIELNVFQWQRETQQGAAAAA